MIKSNGYRVSAREVEDALMEIDGVAEVVVRGVADEMTGEAIKAHLVWNSAEPVSLVSIRRFLKGRLPDYKIPRHIEIVDSLPKNESGKIMKDRL